MGKSLKLTLILMGIVLGIFFIVPIILPSQVEVQASKEIKAPKTLVFAQISNLKNRAQWTPFEKTSNMKDSLSLPETGIGAKYYWKSGDTVKRVLTITQLKAPDFIEMELWFPNNHGATEKWDLTGDSTQTHVTWHFTVMNLNYPFGKWLGLVLRSSLGSVLKEGLNKLDNACTKENSEATKETNQPI
ncbi:MAG: SRPBCC family protein [Bacteroidales bacterium]|nr:SRPBCC family protein [Bacteroidales bacterium]